MKRSKKKCLNDLPGDTNVQDYKLKLPAKVLHAFRAYGGGEPEMYPVGHCMGAGFMMSPEAPDSGNRRLYPLPPSVPQQNLLKWEVVG
jgi:hypothetical protein